MPRPSLLAPALLVLVLSACSLPGTPAADADDCQKAFLEGVLQTPRGRADFDEEDLKDRIRPVCEAMVKAGLSDESSEAEVTAFLRGNPGLAGDVCEASTEVLFAEGFDEIVAVFGGYITRDDIMRVGRDGCLYAITEGYGSFSGPLDTSSLFRAHPYLTAPFCRAPLMQAYDARRPPQPRRVYEEVVTEVCMEAIRTGVIDYRAGNYLNPAIDQQAFRALLNAEWAKRS